MDKSSGSSSRDDAGGGAGGGSGSNKAGKKSDDEEDLARAVVRKDGNDKVENQEYLHFWPLRLRIAKQIRNARVIWKRGHFHGRRETQAEAPPQDAQQGLKLNLLGVVKLNLRQPVLSLINTVSAPTAPLTPVTTTTTALHPFINTNPFGNSVPIFLSSTPPPSPAESGPSFSSANSSSTGPVTTVVSFISTLPTPIPTIPPAVGPAPVEPGRNTTQIITSWGVSRTTTDRTVVLVIAPTIITSTRYSSTSRQSSSFSNSTITASSKISTSSSLATDVYTSYIGGGGGGGGGGSGEFTVLPTGSSVSSEAPSSSGPVVDRKLVGGILGGIGAFALILVAILFVIRRHKRRRAEQEFEDAGYGGPLPTTSRLRGMTEKPIVAPLAAAASFFSRRSRQSRQQSVISEPVSEQGFYRVGGRKIDPVLGGPRPSGKSLEAGHSIYDDGESTHIIRGPVTPVSSSGAGPARFSGYTAASASPTVSIAGGSIAPLAAAIPATSRIQEEKDEEIRRETTPAPSLGRQTAEYITRPQLAGSAGRDGLGRSLPSHDGSRASKFTEDIG